MKVVIFGASGIIGQHLRLQCPAGITPRYVRRQADPLHLGLDLTDRVARESFLNRERPDVIVNLAGESNTDRVERNPEFYWDINTRIPNMLGNWCEDNAAHLIQVSSQAVFSGSTPPYGADSDTTPANRYGEQKSLTEAALKSGYKNWTIVRPTFVLGVRPLPFIGRSNPVEQMCSGGPQKQVGDRWFSVSFARDVATRLWELVALRPAGTIHHIGVPEKTSRYELASLISDGVECVSHADFPGIAPRPIDTTYGPDSYWQDDIKEGLESCCRDYGGRVVAGALPARSRELALFLGLREDECLARLNRGWEAVHNDVSLDWNRANPQSDWQILDWYRRTEAYLWELSWYHADPGWNYSGMCRGIAERLKAAGARKVLCLGDGIGDLTLSLIRAGFDATYHDLAGSRTAEFAAFRSWMHLGKYMPTCNTGGWKPTLPVGEYDAVVSLDFLEHCKRVPLWAKAIFDALRPNGLFMCQNAFAIGSGPDGSMPMHLAENDRYEKEWDPLLFGLGFSQLSSNWYHKPDETHSVREARLELHA